MNNFLDDNSRVKIKIIPFKEDRTILQFTMIGQLPTVIT